MKKRSRDREKETPVRYTPQTVVQTPWVRRTAFQGNSMDMAYDGVRDGQRRKDEERNAKEKKAKKKSVSGQEREKERDR